MTLTRDFDDTYPLASSKPRRASDQDFGSLYRRTALDTVIPRHRNGAPKEEMRAPQSDSAWPPACTANKCASGDKACPCPDACRISEGSAVGWLMSAIERVPPRHFWLAYAAFIVAAISALAMAGMLGWLK